MKVILMALGFMLIFEGFFPMIAPGAWKKAVSRIVGLADNEIRRVAIGAVVAGLAAVWMLMSVD